jgi:tetratricopeptide (TPR) repeat protein
MTLVGRPSKPPPPLLEPMLAAATFHRDRDELELALDAYKKALMVAPSDIDPAVLSSIYASIGAIKKSQGKRDEAELNYNKALRKTPLHRRALSGLVDLAMEDKDAPRVAELRRKLAAGITNPTERADELSRLATLLADDLGDPKAAAAALEEARELRPGDPVLLTRLRELYEASGDAEGLARVLGAMCLEEDRKPVRSILRFEHALVVEEKLGDASRAVLLLEGALEEDPTNDAALERLVALRSSREEWAPLERVYARLIDRTAETKKPKRAADLCKRLARLRRDRLDDLAGAIEALSGAVRCDGGDVEARAELAEAFLSDGDRLAALFELEGAATLAPRRVETFSRLFDLHKADGRTDRAYLAAMVLEDLGAAEVDHEMMATQYRPEGLLRPASALDDAAWDQLLRGPGWDPVPAEILRVVRPAAIGARVAELEGRLKAPDPARRIDPESTITVARVFRWGASLLGVAEPELFSVEEVPGGLAALSLATPTTLVGGSTAAGRSMQEVVFLAARHLTYYRPEHELLLYFPTLPLLSNLFIASVRIVLRDLPVPGPMEESIMAQAKEIESRLTDEAKADLVEAVHRFEAAGGKADLGTVLRAVELSACRTGLVLCGDLAVATRVLRNETREIADLDAEARIDDLIAFCASQELAVLREWLGVAAKPSLRPPAP